MSSPASKPALQTGAELLVKSLEAQGVEYIFGLPGAKIDKVFDALVDSKIKTIVCRHEQNAAFMASGIGRMTGKAGVALVTSGPGCSNLITGFATATSEGDPVVGIGGAVPLAMECGVSTALFFVCPSMLGTQCSAHKGEAQRTDLWASRFSCKKASWLTGRR